MLFGAREAGCFREVAVLHSDHLRQVPLYTVSLVALLLVCSIVIIAAGYHAFSLTGTVGVSFQHKAMPAVT